MKQEQKSWEHQSESLKLQLVASQEKVCGQLLFHLHSEYFPVSSNRTPSGKMFLMEAA